MFIETGHYPEERLETLLQSSASQGLDNLYSIALQTSGLWDDMSFVKDFQETMGLILAACQPLSYCELDHLLGRKKQRSTIHTIKHFGCLLHWGTSEPVHILHPSFADYLTNPKHKQAKWYIDLDFHNQHFALRCLQVMNVDLHFNMCELETSHCYNDEIPNLDTCVKGTVTTPLLYACKYWANHIHAAARQDFSDQMLKRELKRFLHIHLPLLARGVEFDKDGQHCS
jgi:hypothetical protein